MVEKMERLQMFEDVKSALKKMDRVAPRPLIAELILSDAYDLSIDWPHVEWPNAKLPGIYAFADNAGFTVYVGKASCNQTIGVRLGKYWKDSPEGIAIAKDEKADGVKYVATVGLPKVSSFEAPAIEEWLIRELSPPRNSQGQ